MKLLSVLIPVYNERQFIAETLRRCLTQTLDSTLTREIIVVDDGSIDGTEEVLMDWRDRVQVVRHERNCGKGAALRTALAYARGDIILIQDADLEYHSSDWPQLLKPIMNNEADVVYGTRFSSHAHRVLYFWHYIGNRILTLWSNAWTNLNLTDMETGAKVFQRAIFEGLTIQSDRFGFEPEFTAKIAHRKLRIYEVGISYHGRSYEEGKKITWKDGIAALWHVVRWNVASLALRTEPPKERDNDFPAFDASEEVSLHAHVSRCALRSHTRNRTAVAGIIIGFGMALSTLFGLIAIHGDGIGYYYLYRQMREGNWSFIAHFNPPPGPHEYMFVPAKEGWSTYYQIGAPLVWGVLAPPLVRILPPSFFDPAIVARLGARPLYLLMDGFALLLVSSFFAVAIVFMLTRILVKHFHFPLVTALIAVGITFFGMPTWYYAFFGHAYSHIVELFFLTIAIGFFTPAAQKSSLRFLVFSGIALGVAVLVRIDALLFLVPMAVTAALCFKNRVRSAFLFSAPAVLATACQLLVWYHIFGSVIPGVGYRMQEFSMIPAHTGDVLWSAVRGFFIWSPIAGAGYAGLFYYSLRKNDIRRMAAGALGAVCLMMYALFYGAWRVWWGGSSLGQRFLIPLAPFIALGVVLILSQLYRSGKIVRAAAVLSFLLMIAFNRYLSILYPLVDRTGVTEDTTTPMTILYGSYKKYMAGTELSLGDLFLDAFWYGPRLIHLITPPSESAGSNP